MTELVERLQRIVGDGGWSTDPAELEPYLTDWRGLITGRALIRVSPQTTTEVSDILRACADFRAGVVVQGGNTGLCGGATPDGSGKQVLLSLHRLNRIRKVDALDYSIEVEAGCLLAAVQDAARKAGRYFPLSLGAEGSCQIGGNLATNAGGINVIRYGTARSQVLGLEVVLADGSVLNGLRSLRKDTAGYDLKQLFVGSEGTLGIITAATLRLYPDPGETSTALLALEDSGQAVRLLAKLRQALADRIEAFELVAGPIFELVEQHIPNARLPFERRYPWYVLLEATVAGDPESVEVALASELDGGDLLDVVVAKNAAEAAQLWHLRHSVAEAERQAGGILKHDISVPIGRMEEFLGRSATLVEDLAPGARLLTFGHVGDGNLHHNVQLPAAGDLPADPQGHAITKAIYDLVADLGGSFAAEHGVGLTKRAHLKRYRGGVEFELMRRLKGALDPLNTLNPGKLF